MITVKIPQHDKGYQEKFTIYTDNTETTPQDLTGYTVKCKAWNIWDTSTLIINSICTTDATPTNGVVYWTVSESATANVGTYRAELQLEKDNIVLSTVPFQISIMESAE